VPKQIFLNETQLEELKAFSKNKETNRKEALRVQAILMLNKRLELDLIEELTDFKRSSIFAVRNRFLKQGIEGIKDKRKKVQSGILTKNQRTQVLDIIKTKKPRDFGFDEDYWSTWALGYLIHEQYGVRYKSKTSLYLLFKEAHFTFHKPGKVYQKRDEQLVKKWKEDVTPIIENAWKNDNVEIIAGDEMILSSITTFQKIWLPAGEYPKIEISSKRENRSFYGFLNIKTGREHAFVTEKQNMYLTVDLLKKLRSEYPKRKLLLFWDNAGWHRGSAVQDFLNQDKNIDIIYFPPYAPDQNPQEKVWKAARRHISHNRLVDKIETVANAFALFLNSTFFEYSLLGFKSNAQM
jgi:transposase